MADDFREVLYTIDQRGRRKWVYSALVNGHYLKLRSVVAFVLVSFYLLLPWLTVDGRQAVLLNIAERRFIFFGAEFWATDSYFLFLILGLLAFSLFFFTAFLGRVWCGWACPETVFLEFVFRPIERLIEGSPAQRLKLDMAPWTFEKIRKKATKHLLCALISWVIASSALAYFIGREPLLEMMSDWPHKNPGPFFMTFALMGLMAFQFGWFREQFCTVLCPYARFQSALMDSKSLVVGYDVTRGEPRGKGSRQKEENQDLGHCVDCGLCVRVCPTGIDIRNGVQLECIACTACIDACDSIMERVGYPPGLIRYDSEEVLLGHKSESKAVRLRPLLYGGILAVFLGSLGYLLWIRQPVDFQVVRGRGASPYSTLADGRISNNLQLKLANKTSSRDSYSFSVVEEAGFQLIIPISPVELQPGQTTSVPMFVNFEQSELKGGSKQITVEMKSEQGFSSTSKVSLLGPDS